MGTTLVVAYVNHDSYRILHIGDSRAYLWRDDQLVPLTFDHSWVFEMLVRSGQMSRERARTHPHSNIITRYVGADVIPEDPDCYEDVARPGDRLLLCTDGLTDMVPEEEIERLFSAYADRDELADVLLDAALRAGGRDNITLTVSDLE